MQGRECDVLIKLFDADFADPSGVVHDGCIYLLASRAYHSVGKNIQCRRARDWNGPWEDLGCAIADVPLWGRNATEFWSPDVPVRVDDGFRLYYATNPDDAGGMAIAVATGPSLTSLTPHTHYLHAGSTYSVVDPFLLTHGGDQWLFWGSAGHPIMCRKLDRNGYEFANGSAPFVVLRPSTESRYERLLEGFFLFQDPDTGVWYAFVSGSDTWKPHEYAVTCYRSDSPFGGFTRVGLVVRPTDRWHAPGQNSIVTLHGKHYFVCHAVDANDPYLPGTDQRLKRVPCVARMIIQNGQPELLSV